MKDSGMTDKEVISVYVVSHKDFKPPLNAIYKPIAVGSLSDNAPKGFISDSRGIGISEKNPSYCELTALYWIWKNDHETSIVGLCHYRRYFTNSHFSTNCKHFLSKKDIDGILKDADVIVPTKTIWKDANVGEAYYTHGQGKRKDLKLLYDVIYKVCPSYIQDFKKIIDSNSAYYCNMFITRRQIFDTYCNWLFPLLSSLEARIDISGYTKEEARVFGYLSEILFNVWLQHGHFRLHEVYVVNTESSLIDRSKRTIRRRFEKTGGIL